MICVIGEALIDLVEEPASGTDLAANTGRTGPRSYRAHPGGSPYNVAIGLARLGQNTALQARFSADTFGRQLRSHAEANAVDLSLAIDAAEPTTLAIVGLDERRNATYDFYLNGTADWQWTAAELARAGSPGWTHTGSLASWTRPGSVTIDEHLGRLRRAGTTIISYDPNIRPLLMGGHQAAVAAVEQSVARAHVVKASAEDLDWLYPNVDLAAALRAWQKLGPQVVVATNGGDGSMALAGSGDVVTVAAKPITIVDTVGAGDAFMAGLINALTRTGVAEAASSEAVLATVLNEAATVAALTCQRAGADPPTAAELRSALQHD
jgi:fructokinase